MIVGSNPTSTFLFQQINYIQLFLLFTFNYISFMQKYYNHSSEKGLFTFYFQQESSKLQSKPSSHTPYQLDESTEANHSFLPFSRGRIVNKAYKETIDRCSESDKKVIQTFLHPCILSKHQRKKLKIQRDSHCGKVNQSKLIQKNWSRFQNENQIELVQKLENANEEKKQKKIGSHLIQKTEKEPEIFQHSQKRQSRKQINLNNQITFANQNNKEEEKSSFGGLEKIPSLCLHIHLNKKAFKHKAKSQQRKSMNFQSLSPKKIQVTLPTLSQAILQKHKELRFLHRNKLKNDESISYYNLVESQLKRDLSSSLLNHENKINSKFLKQVNMNKQVRNELIEGWGKRKKLFLERIEKKKELSRG